MSHGKIVLMACGSFSPPTYMHMRMFEIARDSIQAMGLGTVVGGIVSPVHDAYGKKDLANSTHRLAMLKHALRSSSWIKVSEWEVQQSGWSRTRVSLQYHQDTINSHIYQIDNAEPPPWLPDDVLNVNNMNNNDERDSVMDKIHDCRDARVTVKLLCGGDLLESFAKPGLWSDDDIENIVGRHGIVVVTRVGSDPGKFIYDSDVLSKYRRNIILVSNYILNEISSSTIRLLFRRGESAKYLIDDGVLSYIRTHKLYGSDSSQSAPDARCSCHVAPPTTRLESRVDNTSDGSCRSDCRRDSRGNLRANQNNHYE
ncbi:nicotinamide/nicotinic acid mononucleotide adenylyltransferase 3 isoform X2 [Hyposmocoma kahamanoa]|uniref:nicotinamide/nicotinic acid mononucleotide adenylyltransferase 3 isoform X2 n=1 Tax=Hyposmocoma kahamanoa TaxID=1477025 RepID=UPI000E6DA35B|nr:nicotinamide/nicotinic acid mononucleotide adenylyltransferase 3 isoform X2 [Hyposmocoma kahamanoa]